MQAEVYADTADTLESVLPADRNAGEAIALCRTLVDFANDQGGHDDISAAILRLNENECA